MGYMDGTAVDGTRSSCVVPALPWTSGGPWRTCAERGTDVSSAGDWVGSLA